MAASPNYIVHWPNYGYPENPKRNPMINEEIFCIFHFKTGNEMRIFDINIFNIVI